MSLFPSADSSDSSDADPRPDGQRERAAHAHLNPNEPATQAEAGTPQYGDFGKPDDAATAAARTSKNDGSNDNPDEFSEFRKSDAPTTEDYTADAESVSPTEQRGHATQNQDPAAVGAAQHAEADVQRAAWSDDDPRYAGGKPEATWQKNNDTEHNTNE